MMARINRYLVKRFFGGLVRRIYASSIPCRRLLSQRRISRAYHDFDATSILSRCASQPLFSIIVQANGRGLRQVRRCLASIHRQSYRRWELLLVSDVSGMAGWPSALKKLVAEDDRVRPIESRDHLSNSLAKNIALRSARGDFVVLLTPDSELTPDALLALVVAHNRNPQCRWLYADTSGPCCDGNYAGRFQLKPRFSWEYLLSAMYMEEFAVYDRALLERLKGFRDEFDGAEDYDLALRVAEQVKAAEVVHIPHVICHTSSPPPTARADAAATRAEVAEAAFRAVSAAVRRRQIPCTVSRDAVRPRLFRLHLKLRTVPSVTVVIPTRNASQMLRRCVDSLAAATNYSNYHLVIIDNQSDEPALADYLAELCRREWVSVFRYDAPFNHSDMHNQLIRRLDTELIALVNNDVYDFSQHWLEQLVATSQLDDSIAGAGARLLYPNGDIQHAGIAIGVGGVARNLTSRGSRAPADNHGRADSLQACSAVTGALMLVRKKAFDHVGGFDAERYPTSYNDVDLWMRLGSAGYRCIYNPQVQAFHEESKTRDASSNKHEYRARVREDLQRCAYVDPYWNLDLHQKPSRVAYREGSTAWVRAKLASWHTQAAALRCGPIATTPSRAA
jgi:GT2 family glycosyltransferase